MTLVQVLGLPQRNQGWRENSAQANAGAMQPVPELRCGIQLVRRQPDLLVTLWVDCDALPSCLLRLTFDAEHGWQVATVGTVPRPVPGESAQVSEETENEGDTDLVPDAPDPPLSVADPLL